jgi:hypothetical protein
MSQIGKVVRTIPNEVERGLPVRNPSRLPKPEREGEPPIPLPAEWPLPARAPVPTEVEAA